MHKAYLTLSEPSSLRTGPDNRTCSFRARSHLHEVSDPARKSLPPIFLCMSSEKEPIVMASTPAEAAEGCLAKRKNDQVLLSPSTHSRPANQRTARDKMEFPSGNPLVKATAFISRIIHAIPFFPGKRDQQPEPAPEEPQQNEPLLSDDERNLGDIVESALINEDDDTTHDYDLFLTMPASPPRSPLAESLADHQPPSRSPSPPPLDEIEDIPDPKEFHDLPEEILVAVMLLLDCEDLSAARGVCKRWQMIAHDNSLWTRQWNIEWPYDALPRLTRRVEEPRRGAGRARTRLSRVSVRDLFVAKKIQEIEMGNQKYAQLEEALQKDMRFVHHLQIKDQMLRSLPPAMSSIPLQSLSLIYTKFRTFPQVLTEITTLRELNMGYNQLRSLPPEIGKLTNLTKLCLNNNQIRSLPAELGALEKLQILDIFFNAITELPKELGQLTRLETLAAQNNRIKSIPATIGCCTHLQTIDLSSNQIHSIPQEFSQLCNLRQLSLASNDIDDIPDVFDKMPLLRELNLFENHLRTLPHSLESFATQPDGLCLVFLGENPIEDPAITVLVNSRNKKILEKQREQQALNIAV